MPARTPATAGCLVALLTLAAGCAKPPEPPRTQLANPASVNCGEKGGQLSIESRPDGAQFGVCLFEDNRQCEEWAMLRGHCPVGGIRITGYTTPAARYCAITGGRYLASENSDSDSGQGNCALPDGRECDAAAHYAGSC